MSEWRALRAIRGNVLAIEKAINDSGRFHAYCPKIVVERQSRYGANAAGNVIDVKVPMYQGYLFMVRDDRFRLAMVEDSRTCVRYLESGKTISEKAIERVRARERGELEDLTFLRAQAKRVLQPGDMVRILKGVTTDWTAHVQSIVGKTAHVKLTRPLLGRDDITVPIADLELAS